jgi:hypothetical protein
VVRLAKPRRSSASPAVASPPAGGEGTHRGRLGPWRRCYGGMRRG